jgi:hypothetical protein
VPSRLKDPFRGPISLYNTLRELRTDISKNAFLRGHCTVESPIEIHALRPYFNELLRNPCNCWDYLSCLVMKLYPLGLIYLFLNIDRQSRFSTNLPFLPEPVFFKRFLRQNLVLHELHCGTCYMLTNNSHFICFAFMCNRNVGAFI